MKKKLFSILMSLMMLISFMPAMTFTSFADTSYSVTKSDSLEEGSTYMLVVNKSSTNYALTTEAKTFTANSKEYTALNTVSLGGNVTADDITSSVALWTVVKSDGKYYLKNGNNYLVDAHYVLKLDSEKGDNGWNYSNSKLSSGDYGLYLDSTKKYVSVTGTSNATTAYLYKVAESESGGSGEVLSPKLTLDPTTSNPTESLSVDKNEKFVVRISNTSTYSGYDYTATIEDDSIVSVKNASVNIGKSSSGDFEFTGLSDGTTTIKFSNGNTTLHNGVSSERTATINLTVGTGGSGTGGGGEVSTNGTYLAFTSDVHNDSDNSSADRLNNWINNVVSKIGSKLTDFGFCGDLGPATGTFWTYAAKVIKTVEDSSNVVGNGFYVCGNHEWSPGSFGSTDNDTTKKYTKNGEYVEKTNYVLYSLGATTSSYTHAGIDKLENYLKTAPKDKPIFILSHFMLHDYGHHAISNEDDVIAVLNKYGDDHTIIFLWGHSHTEADTHYNKIYTGNIDGKTIKFTYASAGCMADDNYGSSGQVNNTGLVAKINSDNVELKYYKTDGSTGNSATIGFDGTISGGEGGGTSDTSTYTLTNKFELGKKYVIVNKNNGDAKALANSNSNSFTTKDVTVSDSKITSVDSSAVWEAKPTKTGETLIGLYNGSNVLKVNASDTTSPYINTSGTSYNAGGFGYTSNNHISYPYGSPAKDYYIGSDSTNYFKANASESGLGEVYIFVQGEGGGDQPTPVEPTDSVEVIPSTSNPSVNATVVKNNTITLRIKNATEHNNVHLFTANVDDTEVAQVVGSNSTGDVAASEYGEIVIKGVSAGTTDIVISGDDQSDPTYNRFATVHLTVNDDEGGEINPDKTYYTVMFKTNGGTTIQDVRVEEGKTVSQPADPVKDGYTFAGWYADSKLNTEFDFNNAISADTTVYAKWEENGSDEPDPTDLEVLRQKGLDEIDAFLKEYTSYNGDSIIGSIYTQLVLSTEYDEIKKLVDLFESKYLLPISKTATLAELDKTLATVPEGKTKEAVKDLRDKINDAKTYEELDAVVNDLDNLKTLAKAKAYTRQDVIIGGEELVDLIKAIDSCETPEALEELKTQYAAVFSTHEVGTVTVANKTYNGKYQTGTVTVKDTFGNVLKEGTDYTLSGSGKNVGAYTVKVLMKEQYGSKTIQVTGKIIPKGATIKTPKKSKKYITVKWKKQSSKMSTKRITGYKVQIARDKNFTKNVKTYTVKGYKKTSKKITKLSRKTTYYVRVMTYYGSYGSSWSKYKTAKTK